MEKLTNARYEDYVQKNISDIPRTSVAEFRQEAWRVLDRNSVSSVVLKLYWTWCALGGTLALIAFAVAGIVIALQRDEPWVAGLSAFLVVSLVLLAMVLRRIIKKFQMAAAVRQKIMVLSREVDDMADSGQIPLIPTGWTEDVLDAPHNKTSNKESL